MELEDFVVDDLRAGIFRVHRSAFTSPDILQLERERIFDKCWLYLGHESEVEKPGDYQRRTVAGRPLFFTRGNDGQVRVFLNSCTHRGALICRQEEGNAEVFQCFYHAWSFNTRGELIGMPDEGGYAAGFDRRERGLRSPPRMDSYRGLYFVSFNPDVEELTTYLAGAKEYIDLVLDQSEAGMRVVAGTQKYRVRANWKLLAENSLDSYHAPPLHKTYFEYLASLGEPVHPEILRRGLLRREGHGRALGNGHGVTESPAPYGRPIALWHPMFGEDAKEEIARVRERLVARHGEERMHRMAETVRLFEIFPNMVLHDISAITIRYFEPITPDHMEVTVWALAPKEETEKLLEYRIDSFISFLGPGGFAHPDDIEALESCQAGFQAKEVEWSDISKGMHREGQSNDELQIRAWWRQWHALVQGLLKAPQVEEPQPGARAEPAISGI